MFKVYSNSTKRKVCGHTPISRAPAQAAHLDPVVLSDNHEQQSNEDSSMGVDSPNFR